MRGAYTAGMVDTLAQLGLRDSFDVVYGTSAGAFSALVFAAGGACGASSIYANFLSNSQFISYGRLVTGVGPLMSLRYLTDEVLTTRRPIDFGGVCSGDIPVRLVVTSLASGRPAALSDLDTPDDWKTALRASACVPVLAGSPVMFRKTRWIDGAISEPNALHRAIREDATHVLVLRSYLHGTGASQAQQVPCSRVLNVEPLVHCGVRSLTTSAAKLAAASQAGAEAVFHAVSAIQSGS